MVSDKEVMQDVEKFQSKTQLTLLAVHDIVLRVATFVSKPFVWLGDQFNATTFFVMKAPPQGDQISPEEKSKYELLWK